MSFLRFTRLVDIRQFPDRRTIRTFKERLIKASASESMFDTVNRQLIQHGHIAWGGWIIDASIVQASKQSLNKQEDPSSRTIRLQAVGSTDKRCMLIRRFEISTASEHDTNHFENVLDAANISRAVLANSGYVDGERETRLADAGKRMFIQRKGSKDKPLLDTQGRRNWRIAKTRTRIEHVVVGLAQLGGKALRSIGLTRATLYLN